MGSDSNTLASDETLSHYNAEGTILRRAQERLLSMLIEFDRICKKHNIRYFLSGGSCLGAVRHGGFIPWDDDIDIDVWSEDYPRLEQALHDELPQHIKLQTPKTDNGYYHFYMRLVDVHSHITFGDNFTRRNLKYTGLFIDILPINRTFSYRARRLLNRRLRLAYSMRRVGAKRKIKQREAYFLYPIFKLLWGIYSWISGLITTNKVSHAVPSIDNPKLKYDHCFPTSTIIFEGYEFAGPAKPNEYLIDVYGDNYLEIPPPEKRRVHTLNINFHND